MKLNRLAATVMALGMVVALSGAAFAGRGMGHGMNQGGAGCWNGCPMQNQANLTDEQIQQLNQERQNFWNATSELRQQIFNKHAELSTEFAKTEPNAEKLAAIQKELTALEAQMDQKRINHQLAMKKIAPTIGAGFMGGHGMGHGGGGCGWGRGL